MKDDWWQAWLDGAYFLLFAGLGFGTMALLLSDSPVWAWAVVGVPLGLMAGGILKLLGPMP
ncbi:hypothetical protein [Roseomonas rosulenta]|uniref:hypothetical protein n=1 Tax=Roseomonas rosulenta TaxID=2748667 RepID=UPI0018DFF609|nr:hypothetical protein [Roseomonas rosulenta]